MHARPSRWLLTFPGSPGCHAEQHCIVVSLTGTGPAGHPLYSDATGTVLAEITTQGHVHLLDTGPQTLPRTPVHAQPLTDTPAIPTPLRTHSTRPGPRPART
ncbi:DUF6296 family protein [Kitasatospora sp. NPDC059571]|uniref:DUF6296 family protein n=1 Tax=Kitasatospora sp. NPDC059571 TaxID=3346871 RepID=UPI0036ADD9B8